MASPTKHSADFPFPKLIAHRGASFFAPENTKAAFELAHEMGAQAVETDVMLTADEVPIIMHDNSLKRTTGKALEVGLTKWAEIKALNAGSWKKIAKFSEERIPTLKDLISVMRKTGIAANVEIKPYTNKKFSAEQQREISRRTAEVTLKYLRDAVKKEGALPGIVFSSFDTESLFALAEANSDWPLGLLLEKWPKNLDHLLQKIKPISVHLGSNIATHNRVQMLKQQGYKVLVYTVDSVQKAHKLYELGVDGVFTNKPNLLDKQGKGSA